MIILLPPSESKTPHTHGDPLNLNQLSFPELTEDRSHMCDTLMEISARERGWEELGVSERLAPEVERNTELFTTSAGPAINTYTGVLYTALNAGTVTHEDRLDTVFISSALFGVVNARDQIPAYRYTMSPKLATWWKNRLSPVLDDQWAAEVVVDCRSGAYRRAWPGANTLPVKVVTETDGVRKTVSHNAKHTRGLVARHLLNRDEPMPTTPEDVVDALAEAFTVEYDHPEITIVV